MSHKRNKIGFNRNIWTGQQYAEIEPGINKITSKATCDAPYETFLVLKHHLLHLRRRIVATETLKGMEAMGTLLTMKKILQKTYLNKNN
jgi:hypothetical protein